MNKYTKLRNNSLIFTIGSFGSQLIRFIMVPLYTRVLSTEEYGIVDLLLTTVSLVLPLLTFELGQSALRFSIETKDEIERNKIFTNITIYSILATLLIVVMAPLINRLQFFQSYYFLFAILLALMIFNMMYSNFIRGIGFVKEYALNGILMTIVMVTCNIIFLIYFDMKISGYMLSMILSNLVSTFYLFYISNGFQRFKFKNIDYKHLSQMIRYSLPLVPDTAMWWMITGSSRYLILLFIGSSGNGLYAVASKIPSIISLVTSIFSRAWQLSYFEEFTSNEKNSFYSNVFNIYSAILLIACSAVFIILKPLIYYLVDNSFYDSWQIAPSLILAVVYQSLANFLGTNYTAAKETKRSFITSMYAGMIALISGVILIPTFGVVGAGLSSALCFFSMFVIRIFDTRKYVKVKIPLFRFLSSNVIILLQIIALFVIGDKQQILIQLLFFIIIILLNMKMVKEFLRLAFANN